MFSIYTGSYYCIICKEYRTDISHHKFPTKLPQRNIWLEILTLRSEDVKLNSRICALHFQDSSFMFTSDGSRRLVRGSVPIRLSSTNKPNDLIELHITESCTTSEALSELPVVDLHAETEMDCSSSSTPDHHKLTIDEPQPSTSQSSKVETTSTDVAVTLSPGQISTSKLSTIRYLGDIDVQKEFPTPRRRRYFLKAVEVIKRKNMAIAALKQKVHRLRSKNYNLVQLLKVLREKRLISEQAEQNLLNCDDNIQLLINRKLAGKTTKYNPNLRAFALTLQFYSNKAYTYVRKHFKNVLPHPKTLAKWYTCVGGMPGFTKESLQSIKKAVQDGNEVIVNLVIDEMAIRDAVTFRNGVEYGYVDLGQGTFSGNGDHPQHAKNALVFMAVSITKQWKVPIAYFLIHSLSGPERSNLLTLALKELHQTGAKVFSVTFDGAPVNISMMKNLGANFNFCVNRTNFKPYIIHPITQEKVFVFYDACHMLKLIRNTFAEKNIKFEGEAINWNFIEKLHQLQQKEGLHLANKLTNRHLQWQCEKMNVRLAAQTLSLSVVHSLTYCKAYNADFSDVEPTISFINNINDGFDLLNSRNFNCMSRFGKPISNKTYDQYLQRAMEIINYIECLTCDNIKLINSQRKTGFLGFIINLTNIFELYQVLRDRTDVNFLLTHKLSQDHLELFFSSVRQKGGFNNNPDCFQFKTIYKRLLVHHQITASPNANIIDFDDCPILFTGYVSDKGLDSAIDQNCSINFSHDDHDYFNSLIKLSYYQEDVVGYISGFVCKKIYKMLNCEICKAAIIANDTFSRLQQIKAYGQLFKGSKDAIEICKCAESAFQAEQKMFSKKNFYFQLRMIVLNRINSYVFTDVTMINHIKSQDIFSNHRLELINTIIKMYLNLRINYYLKGQSMSDQKIRSRFTKLILFKNQ